MKTNNKKKEHIMTLTKREKIILAIIIFCSLIFRQTKEPGIIFYPDDNVLYDYYFKNNKIVSIKEQEKNTQSIIIDRMRKVYLAYDYSQIPFGLLIKIAEVESNFNPFCIALQKNEQYYDRGIFQINEQYEKYFIEKYNLPEDFNVFNIEHSTEFAIKHLNFLYTYFGGDLIKVVLAYNCGIKRVENKNIPEISISYVNKILEVSKTYEICYNQ